MTAAHDAARLALSALGIDGVAAPDRIPWLLALAGLAGVWAARRRRAALGWPGMGEAVFARAHRLEPAAALGHVLRAVALALLVLALAEPFSEQRTPPPPGLGIDLVLALDTSGSMRALDTRFDRDRGTATATRLELAKDVVRRFADKRIGEGDRVGLVVFGETAFTQSPLTSDGRLLLSSVDRVSVGMAGESTALGDAIGLAVKRASAGRDDVPRVIVLLTDGRSNAGEIPVDVAMALAHGAGTRVHTVGIGTAGEAVPMAARTPGAAGKLQFERHDTDLTTLRRIADATGGRFFGARSGADLAPVYAEIDSLERRARPLPARVRRTPRAEPALAGAGGLLLVEIALLRVFRRRLP